MPTPSLIQKVIGGFKHRARYARLADAVTDRPHTHESLQELRDSLIFAHRDWPEKHLWQLQDTLPAALAATDQTELINLLTEIQRSITWELESRYRAR
jgi:hypothetical protein